MDEEEKDVGFERLTDEVVSIDGKYYRLMTDEESVDFIWETGLLF